jgi:hypothetical protein
MTNAASFALALVLFVSSPTLAGSDEQNAAETPNDLVMLVTETSPTEPGTIAPISFELEADGRPARFTIPRRSVLVVTDVSVTIPRSPAPPGRYVAGICNTPCVFSRIPIQVDTTVDGFQKTISLRGGVAFTNLPQFETLASNPSDMSVTMYGYLVRRR